MRYLAVCCIVKDETPFLKEWFAFHSLLGVEHFYVYDNMSEIPVRKALEEYVPQDRLTVRRVAGRAIQLDVYQNCLNDFGAQCRWLGFVDLDEFIVPLKDTDLRVMLGEFEAYAGLAVPWRMFSSNGHLARPIGPVIKNYSRRLPETSSDNLHFKSLVNPAKTLAPLSPHHFQHAPDTYCVNDAHMPIPPRSPYTFYTGRLAQVNHYFYRSQQDFEEKLQRGRADTGDSSDRNMESFYKQAQLVDAPDACALRFTPALEQALRAQSLPSATDFLPAERDIAAQIAASMAFLEAGQWDKAQACLTHATMHNPEHAGLWVLRATAARRAGHIDRAEGMLRKAFQYADVPVAMQELIEIRKAQSLVGEIPFLKEFMKNRHGAS